MEDQLKTYERRTKKRLEDLEEDQRTHSKQLKDLARDVSSLKESVNSRPQLTEITPPPPKRAAMQVVS